MLIVPFKLLIKMVIKFEKKSFDLPILTISNYEWKTF